MTASNWDVAVVGAGVTGVALTIQLAPRLAPGSRILVIGSPGETGLGLAYGTTSPDHLLNVRASRLSIINDDANHFVDWLAARRESKGVARRSLEEAYLPRYLFGEYVQQTFARVLEDARRRCVVELVEGTAVSARPNGAGVDIRLASGQRFRAAVTVLCLGHPSPQFPMNAETIEPAARERMIADPWRDYRMSMIAPDAKILFLGTGLTMVDHLLSLKNGGHTGTITAVSRHGLLPRAHEELRTEPVRIALPDGPLALRDLLRRVVKAIRETSAAGGDWRAIIDGLRADTPELWARLDRAEQRQFLRHLTSLWSIHRHRMAPSIAARLRSLMVEGQLVVRPARILAVRHHSGRLKLALQERGGSPLELRQFDWLVNCSGVGGARALLRQPLVAELVELGAARPDHCGLGLDVDAVCALLGREGQASARLFALGPLTAGRFFEITAVPEIRAQTASFAKRVVQVLAKQEAREGDSRIRPPPARSAPREWMAQR